MGAYTDTLNAVGDILIKWADPDERFTGFTKVNSHLSFRRRVENVNRSELKFTFVYN